MIIGNNQKVVQVRVIGTMERSAKLADKIVDLLEKDEFEVVEWSKPLPCTEPGKFRSYITGVAKGENHGTDS